VLVSLGAAGARKAVHTRLRYYTQAGARSGERGQYACEKGCAGQGVVSAERVPCLATGSIDSVAQSSIADAYVPVMVGSLRHEYHPAAGLWVCTGVGMEKAPPGAGVIDDVLAAGAAGRRPAAAATAAVGVRKSSERASGAAHEITIRRPDGCRTLRGRGQERGERARLSEQCVQGGKAARVER
jgi:hypothetical protein